MKEQKKGGAIYLYIKKGKSDNPYLQHKFLVNETFGDGGLEVRAFEEPQEKLVDQL